ncbi:MAG: DUF6265 family protein [Bryobacteraceae bacterium]
MNFRFPQIALAGMLLCAVTPATDSDRLSKFSFLAGCWSGQVGLLRFDEQWSKPAGGLMLGASRTLRQGKLIFSEFMRIEQAGPDVTYTPRIGTKQPPVTFKMISLEGDEVVFENPTHDFPQRIRYRKTTSGLFAQIEGLDKGRQRSDDFPMRRVACE